MLFLKDDCWDIDKWWQFICLFSRRTAYQITSFCFIFFKCPWPPSIAHHCIQIISTSRSFHDLFRYVHMYIIILFTTQNMSLQSLLYCRRKWNILTFILAFLLFLKYFQLTADSPFGFSFNLDILIQFSAKAKCWEGHCLEGHALKKNP